MEKYLLNVCVTGGLAVLGWMALTLIELDKKTEVISTETELISSKVDANHKMLTPLWEEFIRSRDGDITRTNEKTGIETPAEEEVELQAEEKDQLQLPSWVLRTSSLRE